MPDVYVAAPGTSAAPLNYTVPGAQEIIIKALYAEFDGSGSASSFVPAIQLIAPGSRTMGTYIVGGQVAAGASADASWFPFVGAPGLGIQFDTYPQTGDWLEIATSGVHTVGVVDRGGLHLDVNGAASDMYVNVGRDENLEIGNDWNLDVGHDVNVTTAGVINATASGQAKVISFTDITLQSTGGGTFFVDTPMFLIASGGTTEATIQAIISSGNYFSVNDLGAGTEWLRVSNTLTRVRCAAGGTFEVLDSGGNTILRVNETGPAYHIKAGKAWVADL